MWYNKEMEIQSTQEMTELGRKLGEKMATPAAIELIGDVGVGAVQGKVLLRRGLRRGSELMKRLIARVLRFPNATLYQKAEN